MRNAFSQSPSMRPASVGNVITLTFALVGIVFLGFGLGGTLEARAGHNPLDAINAAALPALFFVWFMLYFCRLMFWKRVPERRQGQVRAIVMCIFVVEIGLAALSVWLLFTSSTAATTGLTMAGWFTTLAVLCQIATVTWLVRYRHE